MYPVIDISCYSGAENAPPLFNGIPCAVTDYHGMGVWEAQLRTLPLASNMVTWKGYVITYRNHMLNWACGWQNTAENQRVTWFWTVYGALWLTPAGNRKRQVYGSWRLKVWVCGSGHSELVLLIDGTRTLRSVFDSWYSSPLWNPMGELYSQILKSFKAFMQFGCQLLIWCFRKRGLIEVSA